MQKISPVTLGTAQLTSLYGIANKLKNSSIPEDPYHILDSAIEAGFFSIDTAPSYKESESVLRSYLEKRGREGIVISTKLPSACRSSVPFNEIEGFVAMHINRSREFLGDNMKYYFLHDSRDLLKYGKRLVQCLEKYCELGVTAHLGISVYDPKEMELFVKHPIFDTIQFPANIFDHRFLGEKTKDCIQKHEMTAFARSIYLQGMFLVDPATRHPQVLHSNVMLRKLWDYAQEVRWSVDALGLAFVASFSHVNSMVIGMETPEQIQKNKKNLGKKLPLEMREELLLLFCDVADTINDPRCWRS